MLLRAFPGRTLDELDDMDWPRYLRAVQAGNVQKVEQRRTDYLAKRITGKELGSDDMAAIERHNQLVKDA